MASKHLMVSESKSACGREVTQGTGADCKNCARVAKAKAERLAVQIPSGNGLVDAVEVETAQRDLYNRACSLGYDTQAAARVADAFFPVSGITDPCATHPAHSTSIRDGYAVEDCEACEVIKVSDLEGFTPEGWERIKADRAAESARLAAELEAERAADITASLPVGTRVIVKAKNVEGIVDRVFDDGVMKILTPDTGELIGYHLGWNVTRLPMPSDDVKAGDRFRSVPDRDLIGESRVLTVISVEGDAIIMDTVCFSSGFFNARMRDGGLVKVEPVKVEPLALWESYRAHVRTTQGDDWRGLNSVLGTIEFVASRDVADRDTVEWAAACLTDHLARFTRDAYRQNVAFDKYVEIMASGDLEEVKARHAREHYQMGDPVTFGRTDGYVDYRNRPSACRYSPKGCVCGKCRGVRVEWVEYLVDVASYVSGGLEITGHLGGHATIRPDRLD